MANKKRRQKKLRRQAVAASSARSTDWRPEQEDPGAQHGTVSPATSDVSGPRPAAATAPARLPLTPEGDRTPKGGAQAAATTTIDIDARVPYFSSDLRRIGITALIMFAVIVGASFLIH